MTKARPPKKKDLFFLRIIILIAVGYSIYFLSWFFNKDIIDNYFLFSLISVTICYRFLRLLHQWVHLFFLPLKTPLKHLNKDFTVDVFTTFVPGEPYELVEKTLLDIKNVTYPHGTVLCSEGDDERLKLFCQKNDIRFVPRFENSNAKAGNVNNALKSSSAEICVILDPDHVPTPNFLDVVLPYFDDDNVGFVQVPQIYDNHNKSAVAQGAAQQTYEFYGPLMQSMNSFGTTQAIGANCTFRRKALDSIGGHAPGLTEDMHTSMLLHSKGWKSLFVPEVISHGMVPVNMSSYFKQQLKWSRGSFDLFFKVLPKITKGLNWKQILHYLSIPLYFMFGLFILIDFLIPTFSLLTGNYPIKCRMDDLAIMLLPILFTSFYIKLYAQRWYYEKHEKGFHFYGEVLRYSTWWINLLGFFYTIIGRKVPYIPTPKEDEAVNEFKILIPNFTLIVVLILSIIYGLNNDWSSSSLLMSSYLIVLIMLIVFGLFFGLSKFLNSIQYSFLNKISSLIFIVFKKSAFLITFSMFLVNIIYFNYYRDNIQSLFPIKPPELKKTGGYFSNSDKGNLVIFNYDSITIQNVNAQIDNKKFPYVLGDIRPKDSLELINALNKVEFQEIEGNFFLDLLQKNDSINSLEYFSLWRMMNNYFNELGVRPVYVFSTDSKQKLRNQLPDTRYFDWITFTSTSDDLVMDIDNVYHQFVLAKKPVIINVENSTIDFDNIMSNYKEIKGVISKNRINSVSTYKYLDNLKFNKTHKSPKKYKINEFKGVYYNVAQDWKDDFQTLTAKSIQFDFERINKIGANTILRFGPTFGDRNIFKLSKENNLDVYYGFQIEPFTDFTNQNETQKIKNQILDFVIQNKHHQNIKAWIIGDGVINNISNYYSYPYANIQQTTYLKFISGLESEISKIDNRMISVNYVLDEYINYTLHLHQKYCSNINIIGLGIHYLEDYKRINALDNSNFNYYISSFGVEGFTDFQKPNIEKVVDLDSTIVKNLLRTETNREEFLRNSIDSLEKYKLNSVFYSSWSDKMEGALNWGGLIDYKGRLKPNYYILKNNWSTQKSDVNFPKVKIIPNNQYYLEDSTYMFSVDISDKSNFNKINWVFTTNGVMPLSNNLIEYIDEKSIKVTIPNAEEDLDTYVLYVFVSDENNQNVISDSYLLPLRWYYK